MIFTLFSFDIISPFVYAQTTHVFSFQNKYDTGILDIDLDQYQIDKSGNRVVAQSKSVLPGEKVSYIPAINNKGADCFVRLHVEAVMQDQYIKRGITQEDIYGIGSNWKQIGDYLYYTEILKQGQTIDVFQGIEIPYIWTQRSHESSGFTLYVYADAIQSTNYTPNFNSDSPWDAAPYGYTTDGQESMPGGRELVRTGDNNALQNWLALLICMIAVVACTSYNRRG